MSSLFPEAEIQLANIGLAAIESDELDIVVGGLGLGYTAAAVLEDSRVRSLKVIDILQPVIDWHQNKMVPLGEGLVSDARCELVQGDFFELANSDIQGFDLDWPNQRVHGIFLDIDHSPEHWLAPHNEGFYSTAGLNKLGSKLLPGGVFGLWSNDPPSEDFTNLLQEVFTSAQSHIVRFPNPYTGGESSNTVYLGIKAT
jgi:spermidine synthase